MDWRPVCILEWLYKFITVFLMVGDVVLKAHENGLIESFGLAVHLRLIRCCCQVFSTEEGAHCRKEFAKN